MKLVIERFEVSGQAGLGRAVERNRFASTVASDGREDDEAAPTSVQKPLASMLAEGHGVREVDGQDTPRELNVLLKGLLCGEHRGRHDHRVETVECRRGGVESRCEAIRSLEIADRISDGLARRIARLEISRAARQVTFFATQQEDRVPTRRQAARDLASHTGSCTQDDGLHARSPNRRTDCALRSRRCGSQTSRAARNASRRGSIARK